MQGVQVIGVTGSWVVEVVVDSLDLVDLELCRTAVWFEECERAAATEVVALAAFAPSPDEVSEVAVPHPASSAAETTTPMMHMRVPSNLLVTRHSVARPGPGNEAPGCDRS
jgi:hypothetical protein